mgnify:FL=1
MQPFLPDSVSGSAGKSPESPTDRSRDRLIENQQLIRRTERPRDQNTLFLTAGKLSETAFFQIADSQTIQIMDLDTGDKAQLGGQAGSVSRIFGFVGNDCIYGTGDSGDYLMSNGRVMGVYLKSIDIVDREMKSVMHYEKPGSWIREVSVDDSRIHMRR